MKQFGNISLFLFLFLAFLFSCNKNQQEKIWVVDQNGVKIWVNNDMNESQYIWEGETFDSVAHGIGLLKILKNDSIIEERRVEAFYGSLHPTDVVNVGENEKYIGDLLEEKFNGYGVYIKENDIYIQENN